MNPQRNRHPFDREADGPHQKTLLSIACQYVPGWNQVRAGRRVAVPYRIGEAMGMNKSNVYAWFRGTKPVARRALMMMLEAVLRRAQEREQYVAELEEKLRGQEAEQERRLHGGGIETTSPESETRRSPADPGAVPRRPGDGFAKLGVTVRTSTSSPSRMPADVSLARPPGRRVQGGESGVSVGAPIGLSLATAWRTGRMGRGVGVRGRVSGKRTA